MRVASTNLTAISPLDGRYRQKLEDIASYFSEYALVRYRVIAELRYYQFFLSTILHKNVPAKVICSLIETFDEKEALRVKEIEHITNHDVKAVEYYIRELLKKEKLGYGEYVHFALTSEDSNAIAYGLMLQDARKKLVVPQIKLLITTIVMMAKKYASIPMLARTHGQAAVPTTVGKELINYAMRLTKETKILETIPIEAKVTGAVGNYNAHLVAFPEVNWIRMSDDFIVSLGLTPNHFTTQILPADGEANIFIHLELINTICIGLVQDMWRYISDGYFVQTLKKEEVGSSTMPQKVNPIDFENAEGNFGLGNALFKYFIEKLPISRLQRDLSDSTVKRSFGSAIGYSMLGYMSCIKGLNKVSVDRKKVQQDLLSHWEIVTEGIQTVLRTHGDTEAYEKVKDFVRGKHITHEDIEIFIKSLSLPSPVKKQLLAITPLSYIGLAYTLVQTGVQEIYKEGYL